MQIFCVPKKKEMEKTRIKITDKTCTICIKFEDDQLCQGPAIRYFIIWTICLIVFRKIESKYFNTLY